MTTDETPKAADKRRGKDASPSERPRRKSPKSKKTKAKTGASGQRRSEAAKVDPRRVSALVDIRERIEVEKADRQATDALKTARALALAHLPRTKTAKQQISKNVRLGKDLWVRVTYTAVGDQPLPFGEDRVILAGLVHLAMQRGTPLVTFDQAGEILDLFGMERSGAGYKRLRQRLDRIKSLDIEIETHAPGLGIKQGWGARVVERWSLPTRKEIRASMAGQLTLPGTTTGNLPLFHVQLSNSLWQHVQEGGRHILKVRKDLMQLFVNRPLGWDYALFLAHRCGSAKTTSLVPHEALVDMFGTSNEADRNLFRRLREYHDEIMLATEGPDGKPLLNARLEVIGFEQATGRGRRKKLWGLRVGPRPTWSSRAAAQWTDSGSCPGRPTANPTA